MGFVVEDCEGRSNAESRPKVFKLMVGVFGARREWYRWCFMRVEN